MTATLQAATTDGGVLQVLALFAGVFLSVLVALLLSVRVVQGYRNTGSRHLLALGVGLLLLVPAPKLLNLGIATAAGGAGGVGVLIDVSMAVCRIGGLGTILYAIYAD
jgi:hypothetical protein